jgi:hypothetical protein
MELSSRLNNVYPLSPAGLREALAVGLPEKLRFVSTMLDVGFGVILVAAAGLLVWKNRFWRLQGALILAFYAVFFWMKGKNEVIRYFSLSYPIAAPAVGCFLDGIARRAGRNWIRYALLALLLLGGAFTYGKKQVQVANFRTIQWRFRPEVSRDAVLAFAHRAEGGETYLLFQSIRNAIPTDAYVWIPEFRYPYYLKRRAWWCGFNDGWDRMTQAEIRDLVRRERFDSAILHLPLDPRVKPLADRGWLERILSPEAESRGWSLWKVNPP